MWGRITYRRLQALALLSLAALLTASLCAGPLYQRAMEQALASSALHDVAPPQRAVTLTSRTVSPDKLGAELPARLAGYFGPPVEWSAVDVSAPTATDGKPVVSRVYAPIGVCDHVRIVSGSCPDQAGDVMVSAEDARVNGWGLGATIAATQGADPTYDGGALPDEALRVVATYDPREDGWLGAPLTGRVGQVILDPPSSYVVTDDWLTVPDTLLAQDAPWFKPTSAASWPVDLDRVDVDALLALGPQVKALQARTGEPGDALEGMRLDTDLANLATDVRTERGQARTTVGLLVAQLAVLVGIVLWMVLVSATDNRRAELALVRLRGRGRRGASRYLMAELVPVALLGTALGTALAFGVLTLVSHVVFPRPVALELRLPVVATALGAAVVSGLVVVAAARRASREPIDSLLRGLPPPRPPGAGETAVVAISAAAVFVLATVDLAGPLATLAPTLLAVGVGLLLARWLRRSVLRIGRRLLRHGWSSAAAGVLGSVRRPAARRVLVMVVVATALVAFSADALLTGQRNREHAAEQTSGAPFVLAVRPPDLNALVETLATLDPGGTRLTPVVAVYPNGGTISGPTVAVEPEAWARVASFPLFDRDAVPWRSVEAPDVEPIEIAGDRLRGRVRFSGLTFDGNLDLLGVAQLVAEVRDADGASKRVDLAPVPSHDGSVRIDASLFGHPGWYLTGLGITSANSLTVSGTAVVLRLTLDGTRLELGPVGDWRPVTGGDGDTVRPVSEGGDLGLAFQGVSGQASPMFQAWVPDPVPAIVSGPAPDRFDAPGLSGPIPVESAAQLPRVAGFGPGTRVVDLDGLLRRPDAYPVLSAGVSIWSRDRALLERAAATLHDQGVPVDGLTTEAQARVRLDATPAAWSLDLSVLVGGAAVLVAGLVMIVVTATTWRSRAADLAALRMTGFAARRLRRVELLGALPVVLLGCIFGTGCGIVAARLALPDVRQFTDPPAVPTSDFSVPWELVGAVGVAAAALLVAIAVGTCAWTTHQARLARLRQPG